MRNCPHCGKEIQDEAAFCRFCRHEVEPPLWLTSLQKCPYCAEWVERGIERCPLCGKDLVTEAPFYISEEEDSKERLLNEVRKNIFSKELVETEDEDDDESDLVDLTESPVFHSVPRSIEKDRKSSSDPFESQEGLGVLRQRQRDQVHNDPFEDLGPPKAEPISKHGRVSLPLNKLAPWILLSVAVIAVIAIAVYAFREFVPIGSLNQVLNLSPTEPMLPSPSETVEPEIIASPTYAAAVLPPEGTPVDAPIPCILWSEITIELEGQRLCVYGIIKRRWRVDYEIPYIAIFSEDVGTFAIADRTTFYTQFQPGDCIQTEGEVELMRGVRPFIDAQGELSTCPAEP
jgi:hypothetical protein